jgi:hypothetical protein
MNVGLFLGGLLVVCVGVAVMVLCVKLRTSEKYFQATWSSQPQLLRRLRIVPSDVARFRVGLRAGLLAGASGGLLLSLIGIGLMLKAF